MCKADGVARAESSGSTPRAVPAAGSSTAGRTPFGGGVAGSPAASSPATSAASSPCSSVAFQSPLSEGAVFRSPLSDVSRVSPFLNRSSSRGARVSTPAKKTSTSQSPAVLSSPARVEEKAPPPHDDDQATPFSLFGDRQPEAETSPSPPELLQNEFPILPEGCYSRPALAELRCLSARAQQQVRKLVVGKPGFGEVEFDAVSDVSQLDLRGALSWEGEDGACCAVHLNVPEEAAGAARKQLHALERRATVTLQCGAGYDAETIEADFSDSGGEVDFLSYDDVLGELRFSVARLGAE